MAAMVRFDRVGLRYGPAGRAATAGPEVLHDLSFTLPDGAFRWLLGPSGAGKTSVLRLMYLDIRPSRGRLNVLDTDIGTAARGALPRLRRRIGVVFQDFRLLSHLSAFDNVALPLRIAGRPEGQIRADVTEMLRWVGLARKHEARPPELSGGEQQRVAIARVGDRAAVAAAGRRTHRQPGRRPGRAADAVVQGAEPARHHGGGRHAQRRPGRAAPGGALRLENGRLVGHD